MRKTKYEEYLTKKDQEVLEEWKSIQDELKKKLIEQDQINFSSDNKTFSRVGGVDISASKKNPDVAIVALVVCETTNYDIIYEDYEFVTMTEPYVPGYLAFREVKHLERLVERVRNNSPEKVPEVILVDGNGVFHSNRFGLACHLGVVADIPTVGCGKTVFNVDGISKKGVKEGAQTLKKGGDFLYLQGVSGSIWGACLRSTDDSTDPIIVSVGHKISLDTGLSVVKGSTKYRVPEPIRIADKKGRLIINEYDKKCQTFDICDFLNKQKL